MIDAPDPSDAAGEGGAADTADAPLDPAQDAPAAPKKKMPLRRVARWTAAVLGALVLVAVVIVFAPFGYLVAMGSGEPPATIAATGGDGLWIGHMWVDGREDEANVTELAATVKADGIKDVFVHDGPLNDDGTLPVQLDPKAAWFVATFHKDAPGVRVQAWLGQEIGTGPGVLDLADKATQARIVASVKYALDVQGFDGVHFDMEPVPSGNWGYVQLLEQVHSVTTHQHRYLSISADQIEPAAGMMALGDAIAGHAHFWSAGYLHQLAGLVNEVALMDYDTWIPTSPAYAGYTRMETRIALRAMPVGVHLLIGLPGLPAEPADPRLRRDRPGRDHRRPPRPRFWHTRQRRRRPVRRLRRHLGGLAGLRGWLGKGAAPVLIPGGPAQDADLWVRSPPTAPIRSSPSASR